ncbi:MAG: DUF721 domain-containing protein [Dissulfurimicrobium sp.]|uniref:DUF721 domain-containing protein n=1 Tax=Dissulfurimicrobium TaxID=1769732 RepID=UPI003C750DAB
MDKNKGRGRPILLSGILKTAFERRGWEDRLSRAEAWRSWEEVMGHEIPLYAWPDRLQGKDTLVVKVSDSIWMQQLSFIKNEMLDRLNARLPNRMRFKNIRFELGDVDGLRSLWHSKGRDSWDKKDAGIPAPDPRVMETAEAMVRKINDKELAECLKRLYVKYVQGKGRQT